MQTVVQYIVMGFAILTAISIHEFGHAYVAHLNGDDTAKNMGRMTINPIKHIDPVGMLMMFIARFGWAKPVPVNPLNYKSFKKGNITVSLAGIFMNLITAIFFTIVYKYAKIYSLDIIAKEMIIYNVAFASFNLLPIPPLDGWGFISTFLPVDITEKVYKYQGYTMIIFVVLLITGTFSFILNPIYSMFFGLMNWILVF